MSMIGVGGAGRPAIPYHLDRAKTEQKAEVKHPDGDSQEAKSDSVQISQEGREHTRGMTQQELDNMYEQLESAKKEAEAVEEAFDNLAKCLKIAMRIMAGDEVPNKDRRFLAEEQPKLYMQAVSLQQPNENPKKHKTLIEEESEQVEGQNTDTQAAAPTPEMPEAEVTTTETCT